VQCEELRPRDKKKISDPCARYDSQAKNKPKCCQMAKTIVAPIAGVKFYPNFLTLRICITQPSHCWSYTAFLAILEVRQHHQLPFSAFNSYWGVAELVFAVFAAAAQLRNY
jgi:hypothetical protein